MREADRNGLIYIILSLLTVLGFNELKSLLVSARQNRPTQQRLNDESEIRADKGYRRAECTSAAMSERTEASTSRSQHAMYIHFQLLAFAYAQGDIRI